MVESDYSVSSLSLLELEIESKVKRVIELDNSTKHSQSIKCFALYVYVTNNFTEFHIDK